jgi:uncharacterized protein YktA (UPF0223 family)
VYFCYEHTNLPIDNLKYTSAVLYFLDPLAWGGFYISKINNGGLIATLGHYKQYRNIYPSKLQTSECKNNLEILSDTKNNTVLHSRNAL